MNCLQMFLRQFFSAIFQTQNEGLQRDVESLNSRLTKVNMEFELQTETVEKLTNENSTKTHELKVYLHNVSCMFLSY